MDVLTAGMGDLGSMGASWGDTFKQVFSQFGAAGARVIEQRYAVPDLDPGSVLQRTAGGTTVARQVPGTVVGVGTGSAGVAPGISMGTVLLVGGALVVFVFARGRS